MSRRFIVGIFYATFIVLGISATVLGPTLNNLTQQFGVPLENGGIFITLYSTGVTIALIPLGWLFNSGRISSRYLLCMGPLLIGVGMLVLSSTTTLWIAMVAAFIFGLGYGGTLIGPNIMISAMFPGAASRPLNALNTFFGVGAIIGPQVVSVAFTLENYTLAYLFTAAAAVLLIPALIQIDVPAQQAEAAEETGAVNASVNWLVFAPFAVLLFLYVGAEVGFGAWIATHLRLVGGVTEETANVGVSLFWAGLTGGRILGAMLPRSLRAAHQLLIAGAILLLGTVLILSFSAVAGLMFLGSFIVGLGSGPIFPTTVAVVSDNYPKQFAVVSGVILGIGNAGAMTIPWVQGRVGGGESGGIVVTLVAALLMIALMVLILRQVRAREADVALSSPTSA